MSIMLDEDFKFFMVYCERAHLCANRKPVTFDPVIPPRYRSKPQC